MKKRRPVLTVNITHKSIYDPVSVEEGLDLWVQFLASHAAEKLAAELPAQAPDQPAQAPDQPSVVVSRS